MIEVSALVVVGAFSFTIILWQIALTYYRLFLSPLARIPGPRLSAATGWLEVYYDVFKGGQFIFKIEEWHSKYGQIIRINPWEVHISDPDFYDELYSNKMRNSKPAYLSHRFNIPLSTFDVVDHDEHSRRRAAIAPFFARQKVLEFTEHMQSRVDKLCYKLEQDYAGTGRVVCLNEAWGAFAADSLIWFTQAMAYDFLDYEDFASPFTTAIRNLAYSTHVVTHFPSLLKFLNGLPEAWVQRINPEMAAVFNFHSEIKSQIRGIVKGDNEGHKFVCHRTVFNELLSSSLRKEELNLTLMYHEAASITGAGIDTTKTTLSLISFWILNDPVIRERLSNELLDIIPDPAKIPPLADLEKLPYLSAVIQEGLRLSYGVTERLTRINSRMPIQYKTYTIPIGTPIGMSSYLQHRDPIYFPDPNTFLPDRWLNGPTCAPNGRPLSKYFIPFSKGPRMCLGMNFALAELHIGLATLFRRVKMDLFETERNAVDMAANYFVPMPESGTKGVRVTVK